MTAAPQVTIVVVPRERFSNAKRSLSSIYENTPFPFELIYVDAGTPSPVSHFLQREAEQKEFRLLSASSYLSPNQARNLGCRHVRTKYTVFLDNDALVAPGWLEALVRCAEETGAWVVGPLCLIGEVERQTIHMAGGKIWITEEHDGRFFYDDHYLFDVRLADVQVPLRRQQWDYVEFHCMLVRTEVFDRLGPLDEKLLSLYEHIDLCLGVRNAGGSVYLEPRAVMSYIPPPPCEWWDLSYFMLRWSEAWNLASVRHFCDKWALSGLGWIGEPTASGEETVLKFARGHRRRMTGLKAPTDRMEYRPDLPSEQAELMVAMFLSVDRESFHLMGTNGESVIQLASALGPQAVLQQLPEILQEAEEKNWSLMIGPLTGNQPGNPALVRLDQLDAEAVRKVMPYSFLTLETGPEHYQCWLAVDQAHWRSAATLRGWIREGASSGPGHLAGSKNVSWKSGANGNSPRVKLVDSVAGRLVTVHQLENGNVLPYVGSGHMC